MSEPKDEPEATCGDVVRLMGVVITQQAEIILVQAKALDRLAQLVHRLHGPGETAGNAREVDRGER